MEGGLEEPIRETLKTGRRGREDPEVPRVGLSGMKPANWGAGGKCRGFEEQIWGKQRGGTPRLGELASVPGGDTC